MFVSSLDLETRCCSIGSYGRHTLAGLVGRLGIEAGSHCLWYDFCRKYCTPRERSVIVDMFVDVFIHSGV